ncbi:MAG: methylmalonyl-CoA mutase [Deltaproteobacteria bacterium]|nr:methylmalonyl-CoA mutase [Deltaproteobacteria bacterium]MBW2120427.1 methylmalonyl-CoA mutase [Deltaproteobacteria bacterium]
MADPGDPECARIGRPGVFPFTRGKNESMYRHRPWLMGSYSGFGSAEEANRRFKELLAAGTTSLNVALDLPTQLGLDSDDARSRGEVGRVGVAIDTLADLELLFEGIDLERVENLSCIANAISPIMLGMFIVLAQNRGIEPGELAVYLQNDSLKELTVRGNYIFPPAASLKVSVDVIAYCRAHLPKSSTISFCGYHFREAGCDAAQEIAFTLADARAYMREAMGRGLDIDDLGPTLSMFLSAGIDFFEEVAKLRAARRMWARMMRDEFGSKNPEAQAITIRCYTSGSHLTAQRPLNNVVRATIEALAAVLGGVQALVVSSMDEALAIPSREAQGTALATQQILYYETGVGRTPDPLGGSYFVEALTDSLERKIEEELARIEEHGGAVKAIEEGLIQRTLSEAAYRRQEEIERGERVIVGLNRFQEPSGGGELPEIFTPDPEGEARQVARLKAVKERRDSTMVSRALSRVERAARGDENVVPAVVDAVRAYATVGEIADALKAVYGEARDAGIF